MTSRISALRNWVLTKGVPFLHFSRCPGPFIISLNGTNAEVQIKIFIITTRFSKRYSVFLFAVLVVVSYLQTAFSRD